jgi:hypothetical protein
MATICYTFFKVTESLYSAQRVYSLFEWETIILWPTGYARVRYDAACFIREWVPEHLYGNSEEHAIKRNSKIYKAQNDTYERMLVLINTYLSLIKFLFQVV